MDAGAGSPEIFIPVHGEYRMLVKHAELGRLMGVDPKNVVIAENGKIIEISKKSVKLNGSVQSGAVMVEAWGVGDVGSVVMRDRHRLAEDGMVRRSLSRFPPGIMQCCPIRKYSLAALSMLRNQKTCLRS